MAINNIKDFIYEFTRQYHFDKMPAEVRARYEDYAKTDDFDGNMKYWKRDLEGHSLPLLDSSKLRKIYDMFQDVFETMSQNKKKFKDTKAVNDFFNQWYGDGKVFNLSKPAAGVEARIEHFRQRVLDKSPATRVRMASILKRNLPYYIHLPDDFDYDDFVKDVEDKKYLTDPDKRKILLAVIDYTQANSDSPDPKDWPTEVGEYDFTKDNYTDPVTLVVDGGLNVLDADTSKWFSTQYNTGFQFALPQLMKQLIDSAKIRKAFEEYDNDKTISNKIAEGIKATDYANKESTDYVDPKYTDQKNFGQRVNEKLDKIKENNINPWIDILRGRRRFFSKHAQIVIEACSKAKTKDGKHIKPTDGLQAFIDNKDAILKKIDGKSPTAKSHFKWFVDRLGEYSTNMPDAFKGALKNASQMRAIVEQIIYDALDDKGDGQADSFAKAKTAMEILSTMKYGIMHSRMMDAAEDALKDKKWLSDGGLSWNKYEGVKFVTSAFDKTLKFSALALGRSAAAARNKYFRDHTKMRGKFRKGSEAEKAHNKFLETNAKNKHRIEVHSRNWLSVLAAGGGQSGRVIDDATAGPTSLAEAKTTLSGLTPGTADYEHLLHDIQRYEIAADEKAKVASWEKDHPDNYLKLMAYWDMLETYRKSHHFTLAADVMRKKFLQKNAATGKSKAQNIIDTSWEKYEHRFGRAA